MPCASKRNYGEDADDGRALADKFNIEMRTVDLTAVRGTAVAEIEKCAEITPQALSNMAPRLRMLTLYTIGQSENRLVAGTGNRSELYVGYFTKWGDGAFDINPISDLTVTEIYEFLRYLDAPASIINKAPSAGLYDGQTDEDDMGFKYSELDAYLLDGIKPAEEKWKIIERMHAVSEHKRTGWKTYENTK
jgi:NAD+ synthase